MCAFKFDCSLITLPVCEEVTQVIFNSQAFSLHTTSRLSARFFCYVFFLAGLGSLLRVKTRGEAAQSIVLCEISSFLMNELQQRDATRWNVRILECSRRGVHSVKTFKYPHLHHTICSPDERNVVKRG